MSDPVSTCNSTTASSAATRPSTSKPRGICAYYKSDRGCYNGDRCKFLHGESERLTPYDRNKICKFHAAGYCRRGDKCWFIHADPSASGPPSREPLADPDDEHLCSICYDKPATYGLLVGCSHIFCLPCIRNWRGTQGKSSDMVEAGTTKTCPMCRTSSRFVTPSALFFPEGDPKKAEIIEKYKASMALVKCKYFEQSRPERRFCPFGRDCFYRHENSDGTPYVFQRGAEYYMERRRSRRDANDFVWQPSDESSIEDMLNYFTRAFSSSRDMQRAALSSVAAVFGTDILPPMYRLNEDPPEEEGSTTAAGAAAALAADESETELLPPLLQPWDDWRPELVTTGPSPETPVPDNDVRQNFNEFRPVFADLTLALSPSSTAASTLDPDSPVFSPSNIDNLRPLPPGPESDASHMDRLLRGLEEQLRSNEEHSVASSETPSSSGQSDASPALARDGAIAHDTDPPFLTDGRGRVVWSRTSSSLSRGRVRSSSSSATILPHSKSTMDLTTAEESSDDPQSDTPGARSASSSRQLVRRRSVPLLGSSAEEFVTDGRGRVVFASTSL